MKERTKLSIDMLRVLSLGFLGAVLFRDFPFWIEFAFFLAASITFAGAWFIAGAEDDR